MTEPLTAAPAAGANSQNSPVLMSTYARQDVAFVRGEGAWLFAADGERYLDFGSGVAVNVLGHAHPHLVEALTEQATQLWHTSNLYRSPGQERLAQRLCATTFADRVFFCNSGTEACEGAIKAARRYHYVNGHPERWRVITFEGAFHGRTLTALAAAANPKYLEGCGIAADGFDNIPVSEPEALQAAIGPETAAIMVEPVMGEGGVRVVPAEDLQLMRALCDEHGLLLIFDEVQTGVGRTGRLFAHEHAGIEPDIMAIAKGIGGGFPLGAILATEKAASGMTAGSHGSTFGGNPLAMAVGNAVLDVVLEPGFLEEVSRKAARLRQSLAEIKDRFSDLVLEVRGEGLLMGLKLNPDVPVADCVKAALAEHLLLITASDNVVRILPPLNISEDDIVEGTARIARALSKLTVPAR
ncbi:acetylornithine/N-succinyldiaminopimelate aminotransferase [Filomicrobium insigne]|uniref:Acetylornithine aminotransferase n=1 Tax=Filomicrobium insigne TaxID=418854 RepID=A0A1H0IKJ4_9HYPH|nr:acetylornithine/N-succinyldiaminopimelate aminotransferase [Filomicrobium insigne]